MRHSSGLRGFRAAGRETRRAIRVNCVAAIIGLAALAAIVVSGCGWGDSAGPAAPRAAVAKILDAVAAAVPGNRAEEVTWYEPENLYEYVDGAAGTYFDAGFVLLAHSEWRASGGKEGAYVELDIYDMGSPQGALAILAAGRAPETRYLDIGNEAQVSDEGIEMRVGRYYARLVARRDVEGQKEFVKAIAGALAKAAPAGPPDAELVSPLPPANMAPHSAAYVAKGFLAREFLCKICEAAYEVHGKRVRMFVMDAGAPEKAKAAIMEWKESIPPQPIGAQDLPNTVSYTEDYVGAITATAQGRWVAGVIGEPAVAKPMLASFLKRLE